MKHEPYIIERCYNASSSDVWMAITRKELIRQWFFEIQDFRPDVGFQFTYRKEDGDNSYLLICMVTEVLVGKRLSYTWKYEGVPGDSLVTFELFPEGKKTKLRLTHSGLETFPANRPELFGREKFASGWKYLIEETLPRFLEQQEIPTIIKK
jgi:uncharacterized protein YndB with AHSA1/START domain